MVKNTSQKFLSAAASYMTVTLGSRSQTKNFYVSFCTQDFRSLLGCLQINLLETWYGERYCFEVFISNISTHDHDLGVKVTDLEF